jgi:succinate dehydrogenase / fumarate reductase, cytochrome b subunit
MADVNRGNRPLSPHVMIYRWPLNAVLSIAHRATGVALAVSAVLVVWWFLGAAVSPGYFATVDWLLTSWLGYLVLILSAAALWFHFCNGIRHLIWDTGSWLGNRRVTLTGWTALIVAALLTFVTVIVA